MYRIETEQDYLSWTNGEIRIVNGKAPQKEMSIMLGK